MKSSSRNAVRGEEIKISDKITEMLLYKNVRLGWCGGGKLTKSHLPKALYSVVVHEEALRSTHSRG